jgi:hypothetical protein
MIIRTFIAKFSRARPAMSCGEARSFFPDALRKAWPNNTAKHAARVTGRHPRTIDNWLSGESEPSISDAIALMKASPVIFETVCQAAGHANAAQLVLLMAQARQLRDALDSLNPRVPVPGQMRLVPPGAQEKTGSSYAWSAE